MTSPYDSLNSSYGISNDYDTSGYGQQQHHHHMAHDDPYAATSGTGGATYSTKYGTYADEDLDLKAAPKTTVADQLGEPPADPRGIVYGIFLLLGIGMLFPWNVFVNATSFYGLRFAGSPFSDNFVNFFSITYNLSNMILIVVVALLVSRLTPRGSVFGALMAMAGAFVVQTALVYVEMDPTLFFVITLLLVVVCGGSGAFFQSGIFAITASFPGKYTSAIMIGQGVAGIVVSISQLLTQLISDPNAGSADDGSAELSALLYFLVAVFLLIACIFSFATLPRMALFTYFTEKAARLTGTGSDVAPDSDTAPLIPTDPVDEDGLALPAQPAGYMAIFREIWFMPVGVFFTFFLTLSLFPMFIAATAPSTESDSRLFNDLFVSFGFLVFNIGDITGRFLPTLYVAPAKSLLPMSLLRLVFIPLFLFCNVVLYDPTGQPIESPVPVIFANDWVFWGILLVFAISNGYVANVQMMLGAQQVSDMRNLPKASNLMVSALVAGLLFGSMASFGLRGILCSCNPFIE
ncbi:hypothetical protein H696_04362 [Fonticula alba]|uniref:Nucleoside transporter n=1 Tax=Fonticula alba TaxID=691883 RepID=A0A058Z4U7_FONAL|nr:hypothetical protein H696_04362 [Fonticula alba]KCV68943.1 hypothetical protein H696_04362 [Fonticula alba]|eukprot:XP_009496514.1 hypothetical protein H696_04362 [Fonticula alba]